MASHVPPSVWLALLLAYSVLSVSVFHSWAWPATGIRRVGRRLEPADRPESTQHMVASAASLARQTPPLAETPSMLPLLAPVPLLRTVRGGVAWHITAGIVTTSTAPGPSSSGSNATNRGIPTAPADETAPVITATNAPLALTGFCVKPGYAPDGIAGSQGELLTSTVSLRHARVVCLANPECAGFMARTDAELTLGRLLRVTFFRPMHGLWDNKIPLACDHAWITFVRSETCLLPTPFPEDDRTRAALGSAMKVPNVTLVTQLTADRHWMLVELASRWPG